MTGVRRHLAVPPAKVWAVLSDGWLYPSWVVGASRMRDVDDGWPAEGTRLHHSVGTWPLLIDDQTEVLAVSPGESLRLLAHAWPSGAAEVLLTLAPTTTGCSVHISEDVVRGPGLMVPRPVRQAAIGQRNQESLRRLAFIAENRRET